MHLQVGDLDKPCSLADWLCDFGLVPPPPPLFLYPFARYDWIRSPSRALRGLCSVILFIGANVENI